MSSTPSEHEANGGTAVQRGKRKTRKSMNYGDPYKSSQAPKEAALDTLAAMILSRVDEVEHEKAVWEDADRVMRNHILPKTLPWAKPRIELLRSLPRDIEDMPGVWHAGEDQSGDVYRKDINSGLFGFGMHDSGGLLKADLSTTTPQVSFSPKPGTGISDMPSSPTRTPTRRRAAIGAEEILHHFHEETNLECNDTFTAAARRSEDPGIIELAVKLPLPSKTTALLKFHNHRIPQDTSTSEKILQGERAETCSKMPLYWDKVDGNSFQEPPAFVKDEDIEEKLPDAEDFSMYTYMKERSNRKRKIEELTKACSRNWKISVKFANTSSRSNLAPNVKNAMVLLAELPSYVQNGQALTYESALLKDKEEGLREKLGSYDCRATALTTSMSFDAMDSTKGSKAAGRSKRLNVGRTRLIWSGVSNAGNKLNFSSLLSGEKLDSGSYKRPKDVKVMIRLNGNIIQEEMEEDSDKKRSREIFSEKFSWSSSKVSQAIETACPTANDVSTATEQREDSDEDGPCYFPENVHCTVDCIGYFGSLMAGKKVPNEETNIKTPSGIEKTFDRPQFICMPVDEGYLRVFPSHPGNFRPIKGLQQMLSKVAASSNGTDISQILSNVRSSPSKKLHCSVCWLPHFPKNKVYQCQKCDMPCHISCCQGRPIYEKKSDIPSSWICAVCDNTPYTEVLRQKPDNSNPSVLTPSRKSQRSPKVPVRYKDNEFKIEGSFWYSSYQTKSTKTDLPKCTLCPHSGGAMRITSIDKSGNKRFTHEVCRIWCGRGEQISSPSECNEKTRSLQKSVTNRFTHDFCCVCGKSEMHNMGSEKEEIMFYDEAEIEDHVNPNKKGLVNCGANGCKVHFHPMCALLYTKLLPEAKNSLDKKVRSKPSKSSEEDDEKLTRRFTFDILKVKQPNEETGEINEFTAPVAFCPWHNPERPIDMQGLPPKGSKMMKDVAKNMHIPYQS